MKYIQIFALILISSTVLSAATNYTLHSPYILRGVSYRGGFTGDGVPVEREWAVGIRDRVELSMVTWQFPSFGAQVRIASWGAEPLFRNGTVGVFAGTKGDALIEVVGASLSSSSFGSGEYNAHAGLSLGTKTTLRENCDLELLMSPSYSWVRDYTYGDIVYRSSEDEILYEGEQEESKEESKEEVWDAHVVTCPIGFRLVLGEIFPWFISGALVPAVQTWSPENGYSSDYLGTNVFIGLGWYLRSKDTWW